MPFRVKVELKNGAVCRMGKKAFNVFLSFDEVKKFERSDGWVNIGSGSMRDMDNNYDNYYIERRETF